MRYLAIAVFGLWGMSAFAQAPVDQLVVKSGPRIIVTLDVKTVSTANTAVTAISAGNRAAGGFIQNPKSAITDLCINELGAAAGAISSGDTICISPGQGYVVAPSAAAVSVIASDAPHPFSGYGLR